MREGNETVHVHGYKLSCALDETRFMLQASESVTPSMLCPTSFPQTKVVLQALQQHLEVPAQPITMSARALCSEMYHFARKAMADHPDKQWDDDHTTDRMYDAFLKRWVARAVLLTQNDTGSDDGRGSASGGFTS